MKTSTFPIRNTSIYYIVGFLGVLLTSCGSYQNSSYYDSDGIYGSSEMKKTEGQPQDGANNKYKDYFSSLQKENQSTEIFTDIDNYNSPTKVTEQRNSTYNDWGSNYQKADINIYPNQWGLSIGMGWGYPYYGWGYPSYGWGYPISYGYYGYSNYGWDYPYYGWNYPSYGWANYGYGWNYPYYGYSNYGYYYQNNYSHNPSRRGSSYSSNQNGYRNYSNNTNSREYSSRQLNGVRSGNNGTSPTFSRNRTQNQNNSTISPTRRDNSTAPRRESENNTRSYTPNSRNDMNSTSRSSSSNDSGRSSNSSGRRR